MLSTGPPKEADSLGFEGSGLSSIGIPVLRRPSRSVGCRRSCGQSVATSAILTWATMSRRSVTLSNANSDRTQPPTEIEAMIQVGPLTGELVPQQMRLARCFGRPPLTVGHDRVLEITSRVSVGGPRLPTSRAGTPPAMPPEARRPTTWHEVLVLGEPAAFGDQWRSRRRWPE